MTRLLIADDSPIMRRNLSTILRQAGYAIAAEATNGAEAVNAYRKHRPELVTMDITMPIMDGIEAVKRILAESPDARIIVISAFDQRSMLFEAMENGAKQYLIKPITAEKLLHAVGQALNEPADAAGQAGQDAASRAADPASAAGEPLFAVENRDGQFHIAFPNPSRIEMLTELRTAVQGLMFVKPLSLRFQFGDARVCHPGLPAALEALIGLIRGAGGTVTVAAAHEALAGELRHILSVPIEAS
jgi:DNA-binding NarL/FixJ family response regulator